MWTNVFRIGGLRQVSWFQFLPCESDSNSLPDRSLKPDQKDSATHLVLVTHLQLQNKGFLSTWTNSFVGPWDPSQGIYNPDEKIKLWLFLPGNHSCVVETAQETVSKLRVVGAGQWVAPGDSEEVAVALSQALRNRIERELAKNSFVRFGDVFTRCQSFLHGEKQFRKVQTTCEFIFTATEESIFVHVIISAKNVRVLSIVDLERLMKRHSSSKFRERMSVIVGPHGMRGRLTGYCPSDLVKQAYLSMHHKSSNGAIPQSSNYPLHGQKCYVEVTIGCPGIANDGSVQFNSNLNMNASRHHNSNQELGLADISPVLERTYIFPAEAVLVPVIYRALARSSLKRIWLQNWVGTSLCEAWPLLNFRDSSFSMLGSKLGHSGIHESLLGLWFEPNAVKKQRSYNSSSNSNSSSISSISSTSSGSDNGYIIEAGELDADADSVSCRQSGLSMKNQFENAGHKMSSKRLRSGTAESFGQDGSILNPEYSAIAGNSANNLLGSHWDLDEDDGIAMDIQSLLSEFGDFGDFFEDDVLSFGEPPGTAESQAVIFSVPDGEAGGSPCVPPTDVHDQKLLPVLEIGFDGFNRPPSFPGENECKDQDNMKIQSSGACRSSAPNAGEFDHLSKSEAMMAFAPEYSAVETPGSEPFSMIFRSPYLPKTRKVEHSHSCSNSYIYGATPPSSPCLEVSSERIENSSNVKAGTKTDKGPQLHSEKYYMHIQNCKLDVDRGTALTNDMTSCKGELLLSASGFNSSNTAVSLQMNKTENSFESGHFLLPFKTVLATEVECMMFQAAVCRIRHTMMSRSLQIPNFLNRSMGFVVSDQPASEACTVADKSSSHYEAKKSIPVRIAGDVDALMHDGSFNVPVGVWRSVGPPKGATSAVPNTDNVSSLSHSTFSEAGTSMPSEHSQPLQKLLDAMPLLVQQSQSFVDASLDFEYGGGPYGWLALQEQQRRGFSCCPSTVHAGCGGLLSSCHSLDIAGVELADPLSAEIHAAPVIGLLQSDIKEALKSAFRYLDGPLSIIDWCKGRSQSGETGFVSDGCSVESVINEDRPVSSSISFSVGEPISPPQSSSGGSSSLKDGTRLDETCQKRLNQEATNSESEQQICRSGLRPTLVVFPSPAILVGYQDDWLKTSVNCMQFWEKAPLEPYAVPKPMTYCVVCPDIELLTSAAVDFFQQLGTVYETCNLGSHSPQILGGQLEHAFGKLSSSGLVLIDSPEAMKSSGKASLSMSSLSDYLMALSKGWDVKSFLRSLSKVLKSLRLGPNSTEYQKEGNSGPCMVVYVVCPFLEITSVLQTMIESCAALGSNAFLPSKDRRQILLSQVVKALSCSTAVDETLTSNALTLSGFSIPKLVLQIVTVESIFRISRPVFNELVILKKIAFAVYNKARQIARSSYNDSVQISSISCRPQSAFTHMSSHTPGVWKDSTTRVSGSSLSREGEIDVSMRSGTWDGSWHASKTGVSNYDSNRTSESSFHDDRCCFFEPLFILAEPGSLEHGVAGAILGGNTTSESTNSRHLNDDSSGVYMHPLVGSTDASMGSLDGSESNTGLSQQKTTSLHCCYGWTEDWRWLICIWTDSRGELLDSHIFPFGGISSRQDTKGLQCLFVQILHQGCQILCNLCDADTIKPRDIVITRIGCFFELECQEWQKAIYYVGGNEVKKWSLQLRRTVPDGVSSGSNSTSLQQDIGLIQERVLPSSPCPSLYSPHSKSSSFLKGSLGQSSARKQLLSGQSSMESSRCLFQWVESISLVGVAIDHTLQLIFPADALSQGALGSAANLPSYLEGFTPVKSLGATPASYMIIPSPSMRFLPPTPLQLPTCLTAESPPLAHLLHSKGSAIPLSTGFVVSKAVPSFRHEPATSTKDEWPSVISVSLVDYYGGGSNSNLEKAVRMSRQGKSLNSDGRDHELEIHLILESVAAELHALSWMSVSPACLDRQTALPFHCDMLLRLRRLLHYADKEFHQT